MRALTRAEAAAELLARRRARSNLGDFISFTNRAYKRSWFSSTVCAAIDQFVLDVQEAKRPILILQTAPQHGKSEIVSRRLPAYLLGKFPNWRVGSASYNDDLAGAMSQDVRRILASPEYLRLYPQAAEKKRYAINRNGEFNAPAGEGGYLGRGVGTGMTGRSLDVACIDDPIKNHTEALSDTTKESVWSWYQTVFKTRLSEKSGQIIMATSWAEDDLIGRICKQHAGDPRLKILRFPAINEIGEIGFNPDYPRGALVPDLHSLEQLLEFKSEMSDYWWAALYQQSPQALGGNVFKETGIRYWQNKDLPEKFDKIIASWDCTFKDTDGTDFVVGQVWGKKGANSYLLAQIRERMSFTKTVSSVIALKNDWPKIRGILIEDKANGPAVIDTLKGAVHGLLPIEPDGSKLARAHAVTHLWEAGNVWIPAPDTHPWVKEFVSEITRFPAAANDDQVDAMTQALRHLYPLHGKIIIAQGILNRALTEKRV